MTQTEPGIPLADLIEAVRGELEQAARQAQGKQLQFEVQDVELEVEITTTGTKGGEAGLKIWVLNVGAKGSRSDASAQKVTLRLGPVGPSGAKFMVSGLSAPARRD